jgi:hypothetical protein
MDELSGSRYQAKKKKKRKEVLGLGNWQEVAGYRK